MANQHCIPTGTHTQSDNINSLLPPLAIPTEYRGFRFRSRLEARWAVFFDAMEIAFCYEMEGLELPCGRYLPDFYLPKFRMWAEVKPADLTDKELQKLRELAIHSDRPALALIGPPDFRAYDAFRYFREVGVMEVISYSLDLYWFAAAVKGERFYAQPEYVGLDEDQFSSKYKAAVFEARGASFEAWR